MFYEEENAFTMFVGPQGYPQCILVSYTESNENYTLHISAYLYIILELSRCGLL